MAKLTAQELGLMLLRLPDYQLNLPVEMSTKGGFVEAVGYGTSEPERVYLSAEKSK